VVEKCRVIMKASVRGRPEGEMTAGLPGDLGRPKVENPYSRYDRKSCCIGRAW